MKDCIRIDMGKNWMVFEPNVDPFFEKEVSIYLEEKETGSIVQDIAIVRPTYTWNKEGELKPIWDNKKIDVLVWGSVNDEDYTDRFEIPVYEEPKDNQVTRLNLDFLSPDRLSEEEIENLQMDIIELVKEKYQNCFGITHEDMTYKYTKEQRDTIAEECEL